MLTYLEGVLAERHRWSPRKQGISGQASLKPAWIKDFRIALYLLSPQTSFPHGEGLLGCSEARVNRAFPGTSSETRVDKGLPGRGLGDTLFIRAPGYP